MREPTFYYFAYGSCMCPVDLQRSLLEQTYHYVIGKAILSGYRLGFYRQSSKRNCGVLDIVADTNSSVEGVLYRLPWRLSKALDEREEVPRKGYKQVLVKVFRNNKQYNNVRTYVVVNKLDREVPPNDWYTQIVLRGAITCGLSEEYRWQLFNHIHQLQQREQIIRNYS